MKKKTKRALLALVLIAVLASGSIVYMQGFISPPAPSEELRSDTAEKVATEEQSGIPPAEEGVKDEIPAPAPLPEAKAIDGIPFTAQAPFGDWKDARQQHGCEEASLLMVRYWMTGEKLSKETALTEIFKMSEYEAANYAGAHDLSLDDTLKFYRAYYGYRKSFVKYDIGAQDIKQEIAKGNPVIVPLDGTKLGNPYYTAPGPERHELVVKGYDDKAGEFITHDPGTRFGEDYRYAYDTFVEAIRAYETGTELPITSVRKGMLVIEKE